MADSARAAPAIVRRRYLLVAVAAGSAAGRAAFVFYLVAYR